MAARVQQEHRAADLPDQGLAGPQAASRLPPEDPGAAVGGEPAERALGNGPVPRLVRAGQRVDAGASRACMITLERDLKTPSSQAGRAVRSDENPPAHVVDLDVRSRQRAESGLSFNISLTRTRRTDRG